MTDKLYCKDCKYSKPFTENDSECHHLDEIGVGPNGPRYKNTFMDSDFGFRKGSLRNRKNDCDLYEVKPKPEPIRWPWFLGFLNRREG